MASAQLFWNPSTYQDSQLIPSSQPKIGGRPPLDLQLWSRLGCFGILQDSQLSAQGRRTTSFGATTFVSARLFWKPSTYQDSQLIPSSRPKIGGQPPLELQLWSQFGCFGILRIPISWLKVVGRPPLELQLLSRLGCFGILQHIRIPSSFPALGPR